MSTNKKNNGNLLDVKLEDVMTWKTLIEVMKDILSDIVIEFKQNKNQDDDSDEDNETTKKDSDEKKDNGGIKIIAINQQRTLLILVKLEAKEFSVFKVSKPIYDVGVNLSHYYKLIKSLRQGRYVNHGH